MDKIRNNRWLNNGLLKMILLSLFLNTIIEICNLKGISNLVALWKENPLSFFINVMIILATLAPGFLIRKRLFYATVVSCVWLGFGIANGIILQNRMTPLNSSDLGILETGLGVLPNYFSPFQIKLLVAGIIVLVIGLILLFLKGPKAKNYSFLRGAVVFGVVLATLGGSIQWGFQTNAISTIFVNLPIAYETYGFGYCLINTCLNKGINAPKRYSADRMQEILQKAETDKDWNENEVVRTPNIVFVQLESFFDVTEVVGLKTSEDPIPNWHKLQETCSDGYLTVPVVGAGTANTEFEVLTGMRSRFFGPGEYPYETIMTEKTTESMAYNLKELGYATHAVHNHRGVFYGRNEVYKNLGFDTFTSLEYMPHFTKNKRNWANDSVLTEEISAALDSTEGKDFVYTVSVQGHGKYPSTPVYETPVITISGVKDEASANQFEYYVNQIHEMDEFVGDLTKELSKRKEKTIVVFYGDHLPSLELENGNLKNLNMFQTQYVIWSNYRMRERDNDLYAYQLSATLLDRLGIHNGTFTKFHQTQAKKGSYLVDLRTLQYDVLYGQGFSYGETGDPYQPTDMKMGVRKIKVKQVRNFGDRYYIHGENFTPYSKVTVDGQVLETTYVNEKVLYLPEAEMGSLPDNIADIKISQVEKKDGDILSVTE